MYKRNIIIKHICVLLCVSFILLCCGCQNGRQSAGTPDSVANANVTGNTPENIRNGGYMAVQGNELFFYESAPDEGLYRSKTDGSDKIKIQNGMVRSINIVGEKIYYVKDEFVRKTSEEVKDLYAFNLYSSGLDGSDETKLIENCGSAFVTSDYIYYTNEVDSIAYKYDGKPVPDNQGYLYRYDLHKAATELLVTDSVIDFWVENDELYYLDTEQAAVLRLSLNASVAKSAIVYPNDSTENDGIKQFAVCPEHRFIISDWHSLFLFDEAAAKKEELDSAFSEDEFAVAENDIYYIKNLDTVYKLSVNSKKTEPICAVSREEGAIPKLYCFGNYCYLFDSLGTPKSLTALSGADGA